MRPGDLDHLLLKLDAELCNDARYIDIRDQISSIFESEPPVEPEKIYLAKISFDEEQLQEIVDKAKAELLASNERPQSKWGQWAITEIRCPICLEYFQTDCYSMEELNECPSCGADMRKGGVV